MPIPEEEETTLNGHKNEEKEEQKKREKNIKSAGMKKIRNVVKKYYERYQKETEEGAKT